MKLALSRKNAWDRLPGPARSVVGKVLGKVPLPVILGRRFREQLEFVRATERWPAERTRAYQLRELRRMCQIAVHSPFYQRRFREAGFDPSSMSTLADIRAVPMLGSDDVREHLDDMCTVSPKSGHVDYASTGGTTGAPLRFYIGSERSAVEFAYLACGWARVGYRLGDALAVFRGRVVPPDSNGLHHEHDPLLNHHYYSSFHLTDAAIGADLDHVAGLGRCFLHVYPSSLDALARYVKRSGRRPPGNVMGILAESENVYPDQRGLAEEVFGCRYYSSYGLTEKVAAATECEQSSHYHVWGTYGHIELLDDRGEPVSEAGRRGEIVATGFINSIVPFIRYRTGDFAEYVGERCEACGREQMLLADIRGHRVQEMLLGVDGTEICWTALNMHDDTFDDVLRFQFCQVRRGEAVLKIVPAPTFTDATRCRIEQRLARKFDGQLALTLTLVETIPVSPSGKAIYVDRRIPLNRNKEGA